MKVDMLMPQMGESITEGTISKWKKKVGDAVKKDEIILEISTDKVDSEIPSPASGVLTEILFPEGTIVPVKTKIAVIDDAAKGEATKSTAPTGAPAKAPAPSEPTPVVQRQAAPPPVAPASTPPAKATTTEERYYSPLVKSLAEKHQVSSDELATISGTGSGGRVTKQDLLAFVEDRQGSSSTPTPQPSPSAPAPARATTPVTPAVSPTEWSPEGTKIVQMDNMRQAIAEHMVRSKHTSPHVYSIQEVDMTRVSKWRARYKDEFEKREGFKLSFTPFFLEAATKALLKFPYVNASIDGKKIILKRHVNLGCAVALGTTGLIVPVIKKAEELTFVGIARALNDLANRARIKKLLPDEVSGGTFTVTNPGVFGTVIGTPIINQPQVAILCLGAIKKRPVVVDDMIAIREVCYLTLSYDHRIVDGAMGGSYLAEVVKYLETWDEKRTL